MRAARIHEYGDPGVIRIEQVPEPVAGPGEVLVKVAATSMNPTETALRSGRLAGLLPVALPGLVRRGGRVVTVATPVEPAGDVRAWHMVVRNDPADLSELVRLVDAGVIELDISDRRGLADLPELHRLSESGSLRGKVVVTL